MRIERYVVGALLTNCYLLESKGEAVVIDPGDITPELSEALAKTKLLYILLTHGHFDHVSAAEAVRDRYGGKLLYHRAEREVFFAFGESPPKADRYLEDGDVISFGGEELSVMHVPGHSPGSVVFIWERGRAVFCGDLVFAGSVGRWDLPGASFEKLQESLRAFFSRFPDDWKIYPGHGEPTEVGRERRWNPFVNGFL